MGQVRKVSPWPTCASAGKKNLSGGFAKRTRCRVALPSQGFTLGLSRAASLPGRIRRGLVWRSIVLGSSTRY